MIGFWFLLCAQVLVVVSVPTDFLGREATDHNGSNSFFGQQVILGNVGDVACPPSSANAPKELCLEAVRQMVSRTVLKEKQALVEGDWQDLPPGCSVRLENPLHAKFNYMNRSSEKVSTPVCMKDGKYVAGHKSGRPCPGGATELDLPGCQRAADSMQSVAFSLIGHRGGEVVVIRVDGMEYTETLAAHWTTFMYPMPASGVYTIEVPHEEGVGIDFQGMEPAMNVIKHLARFPEWGCGQEVETQECIDVSSGRWAYGGIYEIRPVVHRDIVFRLLARTGVEQVKITVDNFTETKVITPGQNVFRYPWPTTGYYVIEFLNDNGASDLYFFGQEPPMNIIRDVERWPGWNCGSETEWKECDAVRSGTFAWNGHYRIKPVARHRTMLVSNSSFLPRGCSLQLRDGITVGFNKGGSSLYSPVCLRTAPTSN